MDINGDVEEFSRRVQVRFVTKLQPPFKVATTSIAIPSNLTRMGLSAVVNNLLQAENADWKTEPFDFLINGELVRMSLEEFLLAKGISAEKTLEIEYIKAVAPRKEEEPSLHDDWVSAVDGSNPRNGVLFGIKHLMKNVATSNGVMQCVRDLLSVMLPNVMTCTFGDGTLVPNITLESNQGSIAFTLLRFIMTGCYDGLGRIWKAAGLCSHVLEGHGDAVTSVSIIKPKGMESGTDVSVATASKDRTVRLWKFDAEESFDHPTKIRAYKILRGHNASVQSVAAQPSGDMVCSGSWDCRINLWRTNELDKGGDMVSIKKRKMDSEDEESQSEGEAVSTLVGHTQCVSSVVWPEHETAYSASWDHSIRRWDAETGKDSLNLFCGKVINCLDVGGESSALIAAGGSDPILRIWDPRKPGTSAPIFQFSSHTSWISACKWHNKSWFHLVSASYDGKVMLWDLRTAWPLSVIDLHKDKVLCADWWKGDSVISGGVDSKLCISSEISVQ